MSTEKINRNQRIKNIRESMQAVNPILRKNHDLVEDRMKRGYKIGNSENSDTSQKFYHQLADISLFDQKYQVGDKIGQGSDGVVRKCIHKTSGKLYAVKAMMMDDQQIYFLKRNFMAIKNLSHRGVIKYKALYLDLCKHISYLVMQYVPHPNLLKVQQIGNQNSIRIRFFQLFQVLDYIHSKNICHRDIKPENIICIDETSEIKLLDFGISKDMLSRSEKKKMLTITGTLYYRAPQMFQGGGYDQKIDIWSAGVSLYKMLTGQTPFESQFHSTTIKNIRKGYEPGESIKIFSQEAQDLIIKLLSHQEKRISASEALKHPWFKTITMMEKKIFIQKGSPLRNRLQSYDQSESSPLLYYVNQRINQVNIADEQTSPEERVQFKFGSKIL